METILELLQTQRASSSANPAAANITHATGVTNPTAAIDDTIETSTETVAPTIGNLQLVPTNFNRLVASYPQGMPLNIAAHFANGGSFYPHHTLAAPTAVGNAIFPWGVPTIQTPPVDDANPEDNQGQVPSETPDNKDEYRGPRLPFQVPSQAAQLGNMNTFQATPFGYPRETFVPMLTYAPNNPTLQYVQIEASQAPNVQAGG